MTPQTLFDKLWQAHEVLPEDPDHPALLYIDLHLIHEVTSPQAFAALARRGLPVRRPDRTVATIDHATPTRPAGPDGRRPFANPAAEAQVAKLQANCAAHGIAFHGWDSPARGIVHVMGPELGLTQPGRTIVCGDSHTATHGAFGALAFGIGTTQVGHVLASQCLLMRKPKTLCIDVTGRLPAGVSAKDLILAIIAKIGVGGGTGHVIEYRGPAIQALSMEARMTVCNMSIEAGARAGMIAPDDVCFQWLAVRPEAPQGAAWETALGRWRGLVTDPGARFDRSVAIDAAALAPMVTYGTHPGMAGPVDAPIPQPADADAAKALAYMGLDAGRPPAGAAIQRVFVGSCTNARLGDLEAAAAILAGRRVHPDVQMMVVPGSEAVKRAAQAKGLDRIFKAAGADWREPGCSMCIAMNGDQGAPGERVVSTSNRNFEGRQGSGVRTVLASPATAAASAVAGAIADPRPYLETAHVA